MLCYNVKLVRIGFTASEEIFEDVDGRGMPGYTITSPIDKYSVLIPRSTLP